MRIGIGGIAHETNCFSNVVTDEARFRSFTYQEDDRIIQSNVGVRSPFGGFIDEAEALNIDLAPALYANSIPSGLIPKETIEALTERLVDKLVSAHREKPLDAIALALHGAGVADGHCDIEGYILQAVRDAFGPEMPIGVTLDLHGNITKQMMDASDILIGVKCYPHVDGYERGRDLIQHLHNIATQHTQLYHSLIKLPWLLAPAGGVTITGPAHDVQQLTIQLEEEMDDLWAVTFFHGFPYSDIPYCSVSVAATATTQEAADQAAMTVAKYAWSRRAEFVPAALSPAEAIDQALELDGPVVINESSDNPGGGSPGDGTFLLREMLARDIPGSAFGYITDAQVVNQAIEAGVGNRISCALGGKTDNLHGAPIMLTDAYVVSICDGVYVKRSAMGAGGIGHLGKVVRLQVSNVSIIVGSSATQTMDCAPFLMAGIDYRDMRILGLKSSQHFKAWWYERANIVTCDPPGIHCGNLFVFDFKHADTSYYPLKDAKWDS